MAGGFTYHELMLANGVMRAHATAGADDNDLRQVHAIQEEWRRQTAMTDEERRQVLEERRLERIRDEERIAAAQQRARELAERQRQAREEAERDARALAQPPARPPEREAVICTPSRDAVSEFVPSRVAPQMVHRRQTIRIFSGKVELRDAIERKTFMGTAVQQVAYEWGYIRALRDMGQTEEADRLERKMRRGSIFRVERGKATAEVKELETLYERETP